MVLDNEMQLTKEFFKSNCINLSDIWLEKCVEWVREENVGSTQMEINSQVFEQWLLLDLHEVEVQSLPEITKEKQVLMDVYCLQLQYIEDISVPKLAQINKIRNKNLLKTETQNEATSLGKRVLLLTLTDGIQEVKAMEYEPIPQININLQPGVKIKLTGPITARRGQLLLKKDNVKILGGSVDEILISNSAENVLAKALKLPLSQNPSKIEDKNVITNEINNLLNRNNAQSATNYTNMQQQNRTNQNGIQQENRTNENSIQHQNRGAQNNIQQNSINQQASNRGNQLAGQVLKKSNMSYDFSDDDDLLCNVPMDVDETPVVNHTRAAPSPDLFEDNLSVEDWDKIVVIEDSPKKVNEKDSSTLSKTYTTNETMRIEDKVSEKASTSTVVENKPPKEISKPGGSKDMNLCNLRLICEFEDLKKTVTRGKFKVHARFHSILKKLKLNAENQWENQIKIVDDTGEIEARMSTELVSDIVGYCPEAMSDLIKEMSNNDECAMKSVLTGLEKFREKIIALDCMMDILIEKDKDLCITKIYS